MAQQRTPARSARPESAQGPCCPLYHEAVELIGKRWTGAIVHVLNGGPMRFSGLAAAVPQISDRLLSTRLRELERRGLLSRAVATGSPVRVEYELTEMGRGLAPALAELEAWARRWLPG